MTERDFIMKMRIDLELQRQVAHSRVQRAEESLRIARADYETIEEKTRIFIDGLMDAHEKCEGVEFL